MRSLGELVKPHAHRVCAFWRSVLRALAPKENFGPSEGLRGVIFVISPDFWSIFGRPGVESLILLRLPRYSHCRSLFLVLLGALESTQLSAAEPRV